jgi:Phage integrase family
VASFYVNIHFSAKSRTWTSAYRTVSSYLKCTLITSGPSDAARVSTDPLGRCRSSPARAFQLAVLAVPVTVTCPWRDEDQQLGSTVGVRPHRALGPPTPPEDLALELSRHVEEFSTTWVMCDEAGRQMGPWALRRAFRAARAQVPDLPEDFRFHDLRHYYASLLISKKLDVKVVQARLRHASAKTTLDTYGHLWPDSDETTRAAVSSVMATRNQNPASTVRPSDAVVVHLP